MPVPQFELFPFRIKIRKLIVLYTFPSYKV